VQVNETSLSRLIEDILALETTKNEIIESTVESFQKDIAEAYARLIGEVIINFGKTVVPMGDAEMEFYRYTVVNEDCNMTCGSLCFDPTAEETFYMNEDCMSACGCYFRIQNMTTGNITEDINTYTTTI